MSALKKKPGPLQGLYAASSASSEKKAVDDLRNKINGLLEQNPHLARKAATILELWIRSKTK